MLPCDQPTECMLELSTGRKRIVHFFSALVWLLIFLIDFIYGIVILVLNVIVL